MTAKRWYNIDMQWSTNTGRGIFLPTEVVRYQDFHGAVHRVVLSVQVRTRVKLSNQIPKTSAFCRKSLISAARAGLYTSKNVRDTHSQYLFLHRMQRILAAAPELDWIKERRSRYKLSGYSKCVLTWLTHRRSDGELTSSIRKGSTWLARTD